MTRLLSWLRRQISPHKPRSEPPRPLTLKERIAALEPEIKANEALLAKHEGKGTS